MIVLKRGANILVLRVNLVNYVQMKELARSFTTVNINAPLPSSIPSELFFI